jgi:hypothetical protein
MGTTGRREYKRQSDAGPGRVYSVPYLTPASVVLI